MIRPVGFVSKKDIGLRITECNKFSWILVDALPMKVNNRTTSKNTKMALTNSNTEYIPVIEKAYYKKKLPNCIRQRVTLSFH